jgi:hypothetical protein
VKAKQSTQDFSVELNSWYNKNQSKTVGDLLLFFEERSFAVLFLVFMFIPSLPIPTGGITTFVLIPGTIIASLQMVFGRRALWLPNKIDKIPLNSSFLTKAIPFMVRRIRWLEKFSRPRKAYLFDKAFFRTFIGLTVLGLAIAVQIAPPFSFLDTLPSMGIVLIALSIILGDISFYIIGLLIGTLGVGLIITLASAIVAFFQRLF